MPEDALRKRDFIRMGDGRMVMIREEWDTGHPDCPFTFFHPTESDARKPNPYICRRLVSVERFDLMFGKGAAAKLPMLH